jgi:hypothetical protein
MVGARVVVDWGIAQFSYLSKDISLFIMDRSEHAAAGRQPQEPAAAGRAYS